MDQKAMVHKRRGMIATSLTPYKAGLDTLEKWSLVTWEPRWECAGAFCHPNNPDQVEMAANFDKLCQDSMLTAVDNVELHKRRDDHKSTIERQGHWIPASARIKRPLWHSPGIRKCIHINPEGTITPDQDIVATGAFTLGRHQGKDTLEGPLVNRIQ